MRLNFVDAESVEAIRILQNASRGVGRLERG